MRQLPGIAFETLPPPLPDALPRMDIAAFVGFAQAGPLDLPVAVEDAARFRDVFGADPALAWDGTRGRLQYGLLGSAVEAFFANGGQRCYAVRVARDPYTHQFDLPGLTSVGGTLIHATRIRARSPGAWAQRLRVGTVLQPATFELLATPGVQSYPFVAINPVGMRIDVAAPPGTIAVGDLLELGFLPGELLVFAAVTTVELIDRGVRVSMTPHGGETSWKWALSVGGSPGDDDAAQRSPRLELLDDSAGLAAHAAWLARRVGDRAARLRRLSLEIDVWRDERLLGRIGELSFCPRHPRFFGNLPSDEALFAAPVQPRPDGRDAEYRALLQEASGERARSASPSGQRFGLAGPARARPDLQWPLYLPDAMALTRDLALTAPPLPLGPTDAPNQDGLVAFEPELFFDPRLQDYSGESLLRSAEQMHDAEREWMQRPRGPRPLRLRGLHAILPLQEATLAALPDAVHRPWSTDPQPALQVLSAPWLDPVATPDAAGRLHLSWSDVAGATGYRLEWDESADFDMAQLAFDGDTTAAAFLLPQICAQALHIRVRAQRFGEPSPWSNTRVHRGRQGEFVPCVQRELPELVLFATESSPPDAPLLEWKAQPPGLAFEPGTAFRVEAAGDALFLSAYTVANTSDAQLVLPALRIGLTYYRVRAWAGASAGPWSNTLAFGPNAAGRPLLQPLTARFDDTTLLAAHRTLLRFCAARGDLLALLALPSHYGAPEVLDYLAALTPDDSASELVLDSVRRGRMPLTIGETHALGYGALYHPWTARALSADGVQREVEVVPPDGAVAGRLARSALTRGAWVSAANQPLNGVLAVEPPVTDAHLLQLTQLQVNLVRRDPRGFMLANDETLSHAAETRPVSVRRLLILLKRLALREGAAYVFEPLTSDFRDRVQHRFERLLSNLHLRGAFQGESDEEAFRVVVDASINPPRSLDLGRFMVELRVAPSRPLAFLRVRLTQNGPQELAVGEL